MNSINQTLKNKKMISADILKWIALITMFIDHTGAAILEKIPQYHTTDWCYPLDITFRMIGRLAFPIYCFLLIEGFYHTRNRLNYMRNLLLFAVISEIPFELSFFGGMDIGFHNVYWTLLLGLLLLMLLETIKAKYNDKYSFLAIVAVIPFAAAAQLMSTDYGAIGVLLIFILYQTHFERLKQSVLGALAMSYEITAPISFILTYFYNGERKNKRFKYVFYFFYPAHLLLLYWIRLLIIGKIAQ